MTRASASVRQIPVLVNLREAADAIGLVSHVTLRDWAAKGILSSAISKAATSANRKYDLAKVRQIAVSRCGEPEPSRQAALAPRPRVAQSPAPAVPVTSVEFTPEAQAALAQLIANEVAHAVGKKLEPLQSALTSLNKVVDSIGQLDALRREMMMQVDAARQSKGNMVDVAQKLGKLTSETASLSLDITSAKTAILEALTRRV